MEIVLGHTMSLDFWRTERPRSLTLDLLARRCDPAAFRSRAHGAGKPDAEALERLDHLETACKPNPVQLLVPDAASRIRTAGLRCSVLGKGVPPSAFVNVGDGMFVASPELCFLLEARTASFAKTVETGYELCGTYRRPAASSGDAIFDQPPLTNVARLHSFLSRAHRLDGLDAARKALPYVAQNSASPKESQLSLISCLPGKYGGYGFPQAKLNHTVRISEQVRGRGVGRTCRCDLFWPDAKLDVEYDSKLHHAGAAEQIRDSARRTALAYEGILVITVTSEQLHARSEMDKVARAMAKRLGVRCRSRARDWKIKQIRLRSELLREEQGRSG